MATLIYSKSLNSRHKVCGHILGLTKRCLSTGNLTDSIRSYLEKDVFLIELNRPTKRNCINSEMAVKLLDAIESFENNPQASVGVLYGKGGNFCAGFDMSEFKDPSKSRLRIGLDKWMIKKPMIAALEGYTLAGGLELALMCDLRVCEEDAVLGTNLRPMLE